MRRSVHLAGHAVAAHACGLAWPELAMNDATCTTVRRLGGAPRGPARTAVEAEIIVALAGSEAETLASGTPAEPCSDVTRLLTDGDPAEAAPYVEWLRLKAARTIEHPLRQRLVRAIAERLLAEGALRSTAVHVIAAAEISRYMRGQ